MAANVRFPPIAVISACGTTAGMTDRNRLYRSIVLVVIVVVAWLAREVVIWLGYSWIAGTAIGVAIVLGAFLFLSRRTSNR